MPISIFDLYSVGVGPSSSHTMGPMRAAHRFISELNLQAVEKVIVELYGSLSLTGRGHAIDKALVSGLEGNLPETVDVDHFNVRLDEIRQSKALNLFGQKLIPFIEDTCFIFSNKSLPYHVNGMRFKAFDKAGDLLSERTFFSIGGGFIIEEGEDESPNPLGITLPYPYKSAAELMSYCERDNCRISDIVLENEKSWRSMEEIEEKLSFILSAMRECVERGLKQEGVLPGGLNVRRRASLLYAQLQEKTKGQPKVFEGSNTMRWLNTFAMAVNEENAAYGRVVTAPTNGAAGVIPSILYYLEGFHSGLKEADLKRLLLTAGGIGLLYKLNASISGAEVGCQGEVGVACSMAAAGLTEVLGGNIYQAENAAEVAMEHHLGLTCDPVGGLVQVPCIERNGMAAVRALNVSQLALMEDGEHLISLDQVIATMYRTGRDMLHIYKETSLGGLAVNVIEC